MLMSTNLFILFIFLSRVFAVLIVSDVIVVAFLFILYLLFLLLYSGYFVQHVIQIVKL